MYIPCLAYPLELKRDFLQTNRLKGLVKSLFEQGICSFGSFLFFFALARWLGAERFGLFAAVWVGVQVLVSITTAWVYLPVTSMAVQKPQQSIFYGVCLNKFVRILFLVPVFLPIALSISAPRALKIPSLFLLGVCLCAITITVDFLRCYLIRQGHKLSSALLVAAKWTGAILLIFLATRYQILSTERAVVCLILGNLLAVVIIVIVIKRLQIDIRSSADKEIRKSLTVFSRPLLLQTVSGSLSALLTAFVMCTWVSIAAYGAYQALRSICNVFSPIMQMINTHYSSYLARHTSLRRHRYIEYLIILGGGFLVCISWIFKDWLIRVTIGPSYSAYAALLPLILFHTTIMLSNSLMGAGIRRSGNTGIFYYYSFVGLAGSIVLIPLAMLARSLQPIVWVIVLSAIAQFELLRLAQRRVFAAQRISYEN